MTHALIKSCIDKMLSRLALHPCRESLQKMLGHNTEGRLPTRKQHCIVTFSMFCIVLCLGATLTELGTVFAVIGGVSTTAIGIVYISNLQCVLKPLISCNSGFLLPGAAYMRIFLPELLCGESFKSKADQDVVGSWPLMLGAFALVIISMPIMYFAILDAVL